jgi:hypothetical protein
VTQYKYTNQKQTRMAMGHGKHGHVAGSYSTTTTPQISKSGFPCGAFFWGPLIDKGPGGAVDPDLEKRKMPMRLCGFNLQKQIYTADRKSDFDFAIRSVVEYDPTLHAQGPPTLKLKPSA